MNRKKNHVLQTPGGSALMIIFAVLCLAVFAVLALSGALAGDRLGDASVENISAYYEADCAAEEILTELRSGRIPADVEKNGEEYSWSCPISDTRSLICRVTVSGEDYEILQWQAKYTGSWSADDSLGLWSGN